MLPARATVLASNIPHFGGLSGLELSDNPRELIAVSDRGWAVRFEKDRPHANRDIRPIGGLPPLRSWQDAESLRRDADGGLWVAFEGHHRLVVHRPGWSGLLKPPKHSIPLPDTRNLAGNRGMEALAVFPDGRALAISEDRPVARAFISDRTRRISYAKQYRTDLPPVDAVALPNGGVLVLVRTPVWPLPPLFASRIDYVEPG